MTDKIDRNSRTIPNQPHLTPQVYEFPCDVGTFGLGVAHGFALISGRPCPRILQR